MEWLAASAVVEGGAPPNHFYLCPADSVELLAAKITPSSAHFGLLLAMDARRMRDDTIVRAAKIVLSRGLAYLCAWGLDCERVHDLFDGAAREINSKLAGDNVIMTTWHSDEPLEEVLWFFVHAAFPTEIFEKSCKDWIIAPIANPEWEQKIRRKIVGVSTTTE